MGATNGDLGARNGAVVSVGVKIGRRNAIIDNATTLVADSQAELLCAAQTIAVGIGVCDRHINSIRARSHPLMLVPDVSCSMPF